MKSWEDLTELEQLACTYVADYEQEIERCVEQLKENQAQDAIRHAANIAELEATIVKLIGMGAKNRDDAIRWIADGEEVHGDMEYLCYKLGIPYGYFASQPLLTPA